MLELLVLSIIGLGIGSMLVDIFNDNDDATVDSSDSDEASDDDIEDDDDISESIGDPEFIGGAVSQDSTLTMDQQELDALIADAQSDDEIPVYRLSNDATLTFVIDGEIEGYLHTVTYSGVDQSEDAYDDRTFVGVVWTPTSEAPDLDYFTGSDDGTRSDAPDDSFYGNEDAVLLYAVEVSNHYNSDYTRVNTVISSGNFEWPEGTFETQVELDESIALPEGTWYTNVDGDLFTQEMFDDLAVSPEAEIDVQILTEDTALLFEQSEIDAMIDATALNDQMSVFDVQSGAQVTLDLPENDGTYYHIIDFYDHADGTNVTVFAQSSSAEPPEYLTSDAQGHGGSIYFIDSDVEPIFMFRSADGSNYVYSDLVYDDDQIASIQYG